MLSANLVSPYSCPHSRFIRDAPMSEPTPYIFDVTTANFDQAVIQNSFEKPVLVDFWAEWCAPCKALMPMLAKIAESYQGELLLAKVDCEAEQDIVARFGIQSLPTVVLFKDGQTGGRFCRGTAGVGSTGNAGAPCANATTGCGGPAGAGSGAVQRRAHQRG